ncbi:TPA: tRNA guanosine(34) transglycosylase Tgt [Patescibacteria group bacterium]|nr:tRNA guanosine(34) transglycosylase Tgt [Patescibacteria group bacterium]
MFTLQHQSTKSQARAGIFKTAHGGVPTPFFLPIATRGAVKGLTMAEVKNLGASIILSNTYHLWLKPGVEIIRAAGGLHKFMGWPGPILTDSGGFQVFSLSKYRKVTDSGVEFKSPSNGATHHLTPKLALQIQADLGSDIVMVLDECVASDAGKDVAKEAVARTTLWAREQAEVWPKIKKSGQQLFGIVQGSVYKDLRLQSAAEISSLPFDGIAIGGLAVGEEAKEMYKVLDYTVPVLPPDKLHYLMGVGYPENILEAVKRGIDCFDCVIPTREARHGRVYVWNRKVVGDFKKPNLVFDGKKKFYSTLYLKSAAWAKDNNLIDDQCACPACSNHKATRSYLRHLFASEEVLAERLASLHNLYFYLELMRVIRQSIVGGII